MSEMLIILDDPAPDIGYPIASVLTEERAIRIIEESKGWPLPWEDAWKRMYVQGKVEPRRVVKQGRKKK